MLRAWYPKSPAIFATAAVVVALLAVPAFPFEETCPADLDADGEVGITDLLTVLAEWGVGSGTSDFTGAEGVADGVVDFHDFLGVLATWGPCP